jgi:hypothetical protein
MGRWHAQLLRDGLDAALALAQAKRNELVVYTIAEQPVRSQVKQKALEGDALFDQIVWDLNNLPSGFKRSAIQATMHHEMLMALLPFIYGREWEMRPTKIMQRFDLQFHWSDVIAFGSRRMGKSSATEKAAYATFRRIPVSQLLFAQRLSMAQQTLQGIKNEFLLVKDKEFIIKTNNRSCFAILGFNDEKPRTITAKAARTSVS